MTVIGKSMEILFGGFFTYSIENEVCAKGFCDGHDPLCDILTFVVDDFVSAKTPHIGFILLGTGGDDF